MTFKKQQKVYSLLEGWFHITLTEDHEYPIKGKIHSYTADGRYSTGDKERMLYTEDEVNNGVIQVKIKN